ncbi:UNVERIFIED_CONTAM: Ferric reduction oxidase 2 [Sesamum radiatum]|uniref:ferric-chelate reductase (NADH) n=1 Tax=Sesamum radiatum TaxID=300843 RepID=A0AAW2KQQ4_SESRA
MASSAIVRRAILLLALLVFLGYIMMWIIMPTDTYYNHWLLHILSATNSTFFGIQGPIMLDFTFPILFIAVLGCIYLHLGEKKSSITERLCAALVQASPYALSHKRRKRVGKQSGESGFSGRGGGNLCLAFLFYPVTRGSSILPVLGLTSEGSIKYHIWLGNIAMVLFTLHGFLYFVYWGFTNRLSELGRYLCCVDWPCGVTTYPTIRRKMFELFFYTHYLYILFLIFFIFHTGIGFACIMLPGLYLFLIDRYLRFLQSREKVRLFSARVLPCHTIELNFSKTRGLSYNPTSTIFINVPSISKLQWHPFTITSNSNLEPETLSVIIKCEGSWTRKLYDVISSPSPIDHLQVSVEGPYGPATTNFLRHDMLVMISGGSGITPFISIIRELIFIRSTLKCKTPKIKLISVFKNFSNLSILDLILPTSSYSPNSGNLDLQIEAYVTRENGNHKGKFEPSRTICFKPNASDEPISPALGPNSWLWLGAIISSSFTIFLVLLGLFTQYIVYPVDQNTYKLYSYTKKASVNMLIICFSIVIAASGAFLWNKKQSAKEAKQLEHTEESTTIKSSEDVELEILPLESVTKSINVHYGHRPNLKRILMEIKESNVGALVSCPKEMREDVAAICSSGQADNLHFESISFTW